MSLLKPLSYPDRLADLAVKAFEKYVSDFFISLVSFSLCPWKNHPKKKHIQQTCKQLAELVRHEIPPALASEITVKILKSLDNAYNQMQKTCSLKHLNTIIPEVVHAVIHPSVTSLDCLGESKHITQIDYFKTINSNLIFRVLPKINNLKQLRLQNEGVHDKLLRPAFVSENLEDITFHGCRDQDLKVISEYCTNLKKLNISKSSHLTSAIVDSIISFKYLEELIIDEISITRRGQRKILTEYAELLANSGDSTCPPLLMKRFSCFNPSDTDLKLIVNTFKNLTSVSITVITACNVINLQSLEYLSNLTLKYGDFDQVLRLLQVIGKQLLSLSLEGIRYIDLSCIVRYCPSVTCLYIKPKEEHDHDLLIAMEYIPECSSVRCLHLSVHFPMSALVSFLFQCVNLEKLYIVLSDIFPLGLFKNLLQCTKLKCLKECIFQQVGMKKDILVQFFEHYIVVQTIRYNCEGVKIRKCILNEEEIYSNSVISNVCASFVSGIFE